MLHFKIHLFDFAGRHYLLLPKLNLSQMTLLYRRFRYNGYSVNLSSILTARSGRRTISVSPSGLSWSSGDLEDSVIPAIPDLLSYPKEEVPLRDLAGLYFRTAGKAGRHATMTPRLESHALWDSLRASDACGLAPDEHFIARSLLSKAHGTFRMFADFIGDDPVPHVLGRRRYFESTIGAEEAETTLRVAGCRAVRNSYLPRDGMLTFCEGPFPRAEHLWTAFEGIGEWCSYTSN